MLPNKACSHLKLQEIPNRPLRGDVLLQLGLAVIVPCDAHPGCLQVCPHQAIIVASAPTWNTDSKK